MNMNPIARLAAIGERIIKHESRHFDPAAVAPEKTTRRCAGPGSANC